MLNIYNNQFIDKVDKLNKMAYMIVNGNAKEWSAYASRNGIISYEDRARTLEIRWGMAI